MSRHQELSLTFFFKLDIRNSWQSFPSPSHSDLCLRIWRLFTCGNYHENAFRYYMTIFKRSVRGQLRFCWLDSALHVNVAAIYKLPYSYWKDNHKKKKQNSVKALTRRIVMFHVTVYHVFFLTCMMLPLPAVRVC